MNIIFIRLWLLLVIISCLLYYHIYHRLGGITLQAPSSSAFYMVSNVNNSFLANASLNASKPLIVNGIEVFRDVNYHMEEAILQLEKNIIKGLGAKGHPVYNIYWASEQEIQAELKKEAINKVLSERIPYDREVPDYRHSMCRSIKYNDDLPMASIIIIFHNEIWSLLIRTIHTTLLNTPKKYLKEIILVDDASNRDELLGKLDYYIYTRLPKDVVRLIRLPRRSGLIRTRIAGAREATGDVIIFLDSHCEAGPDWIQPILFRIKRNPSVVVMPIIEWIDRKHFGYISNQLNHNFKVGAFTWSGYFIYSDIPDRELLRRSSPIDPARSATMLGGLLALRRDFFWRLGAYDDGMEIWGGENLEMSFRIWQCGGILEVHPCSRVGHVFRPVRPYSFDGKNDTHGYNTARLAEVWMDDYKRFFYLHKPHLKEKNIGDVNNRKELRKNLKCKDFKWFLDNVIPEKFVMDEHSLHWGRVQARNKNICLDSLQKPEYAVYYLGVYSCHDRLLISQFFSLSKNDELRREYVCADVTGRNVTMVLCNGRKRQKWKYTKDGWLQHITSRMCISHINAKPTGSTLKVSKCTMDVSLRWVFEYGTDETGKLVQNF